MVGHEVRTVQQEGWKGLTNGQLLQKADEQGFDVFVTADHNIEFQQNLKNSSLAFTVLQAPSNDLDDLLPLVPAILAAIDSVRPGDHPRR